MDRIHIPLLALLTFGSATNAVAQNVTLQADDGTFDSMWSLTAPNAGDGDWIGVAYTPPYEFPFAVTSATMYYVDEFCCQTQPCNTTCTASPDWDARVIAPANLTVDAGGLTPDLANPVFAQGAITYTVPVQNQRYSVLPDVNFNGSGSTYTSPPWTLFPDQWTLPAGTIFDAPGRVFYAIKYIYWDAFMNFAVDESALSPVGTSIFTNDNFATRSSIWTIGNVGMRVNVQPVFFLKLADSNPGDTFQVAGASNVTMLAFRIRGGTTNTTVGPLTVRASGTGDDFLDVQTVRLVVDQDQDGVADAGEPVIATGTYNGNDGAVILSPNRTLTVGTTEEWLVVYDFNTSPVGGETFTARIQQASDVGSNVGAPYVSGTTNGTGGFLGDTVTVAGRLAVGLGPNSMAPSVIPAGASNLATLQLRVTAVNETFDLTSLSFTAGGTLNDVTQINAARLYRDNNGDGVYQATDTQLGGAQTFTQNDGRITFTFAAQNIPASTWRDFIVVYDLAGTANGGATFRTIFASPGDIVATGIASGAVPPTGQRALTGAPVIGNDGTVGGALTAALGAASNPAGTAQPNATNVPMLQVQFSAQAEAVDLDTLTFTASGSGNETTHVARVRLYRDVNANGTVDGGDVAVGLPQTFATNDGIVTFSTGGESVPASATRTYLVTYDFSAAPTGGETFAIRLNASGDVGAQGGASGAPITAMGMFPIQGNTLTTLGGLSITTGPENPPATNRQPGSTDVPVLQVAVAAQGETFTVSSLRLSAAGSMLDDAGVAQVRLLRDTAPFGVVDGTDTLLGTSSFAADDGVAIFNFTPAVTVSAGANERWLFVYDLSLLSTPGQTFRASIASAADFTATGSLSGATTASGLPVAGSDHAIGGALTITAGPANPAGGSVTPSAADVVMMQARLTAVLEPVTVTSVTFTANGNGNELTDVANATLWIDTNNNGVLETVGDVALGTPQSFTQNDGTVTFTFPGRTLPAGANESWIVAYDFAGAAVAGNTFGLSIVNDTAFTAMAPSGMVPRTSGAPVAGGTKTVLGQLMVARGAQSMASTTVPRTASGVPVLQVALTGVGEAFTVTGLSFVAAGSVDDQSDITGVTLYLDNDGDGALTTGDTALSTPSTFSGDDGVVTFSGLSLSLPAGTTRNVLFVVDFAGSAEGGTTLRINMPDASYVTATGFAGRNITDAAGLPISANPLTVGGTLEVGLGVASPIARVVRPNEVGIGAMQLRLVADTEPVTITSLTLNASGTGNDATGIAAVDLYLDGDGNGLVGAGEPQLGSGTFNANDGTVTFTLTQAIQVGPAVHLLARVAMTTSPVGGETFTLSVDPAQDVAITSASGAVSVTGVPLTGALLTAGGGFEVALGAQSSLGGAVNQSQQNAAVLQLDLRAVNEACTVNGLVLRGVGSIDDSADVAGVRLVHDLNDNGLVDFNDVDISAAATFPNDDGVVTFTNLARMLGTNASQRWLVVYDLSGSASNLETFSVRLEDNLDLDVACAVSGPVTPTGAPIDSASFSIQEDGAMVVSRGAQSPPGLFVAEGTVRAAVLQIRVGATVQPLTLQGLTLTTGVSAGAASDVVAQIDLFRDVNQDGVLDRTDVLLASGTAPDANGLVPFAGLALPVPTTEAQFLIATVNIAAGATPGTTFTVGIANDSDVAATSAFGNPLVTGAPVVSNTMTVAGHLNIGAASTPMNQTVQNDDAGLVALDLAVSATWETFRLRSLTLTTQGSMSPSASVGAVTLISDDDDDGLVSGTDRRIAERVTFPENSRRTVIAGLDEVVDPASPRRLLVVLDLDGVATVDESIAVSIAANVDVLAEGDSVGLTSPVGAPILGPTLTVGGSLQIAAGPAAPMDQIVAANAELVPVLQLAASAFNEDVTLSRLSVSASGSLDDTTGIDDVHLFLDANADGRIDPGDVEVAPVARVAGDDGKATFGPIAERVTRNTTAHFLVAIDLSGIGQAGEEVTFSLESDADVSAFGALSGAIAATGAPVEGARVSLVGALNVRIGVLSPAGRGVRAEERVTALQLEIFTRGETVTLDQLVLTTSGTADDASAIAMVRLYVDGDEDGEASETDMILANAPVDGDDGRVVLPSLAVNIPSDTSVTLVAEVEIAADAATGGTLRLALESNDDLRATGMATGDVSTVGAPVVGSSFTIVPPPRTPVTQAEEDSGCGCSVAKRPGPSETPRSAVAALGLALLIGLRRRRRNVS